MLIDAETREYCVSNYFEPENCVKDEMRSFYTPNRMYLLRTTAFHDSDPLSENNNNEIYRRWQGFSTVLSRQQIGAQLGNPICAGYFEFYQSFDYFLPCTPCNAKTISRESRRPPCVWKWLTMNTWHTDCVYVTGANALEPYKEIVEFFKRFSIDFWKIKYFKWRGQSEVLIPGAP